MSRLEAGIRRGVMAADQFTQIANTLFRDTQFSYKAKGVFGYVSTHRDGWQVTITDLVRLGPDGREAVRTALKELEKRGFLIRKRERDPDGTLGAAAYFITDLPSPQNHRSQPESGFPPVENPTLADRPTRNTNSKKSNKQKTNPLRPCDRGDAAHTILRRCRRPHQPGRQPVRHRTRCPRRHRAVGDAARSDTCRAPARPTGLPSP
ncbi:hypothetical protein ACGFZ9_29120 [Streptomyces mirabilis]|uniref:hypothetical protein n=1 Tax=Streptomyces mirabilis TaxID=68239 RepID=UPI0037154C42